MRASDVFSVAGKVAFVTGAAAGLGRAMAQALAVNGARLWLHDRDPVALDATGAALRTLGAEVTTQVGDVTDGPAVAGAVATLLQHYPTLDIAIANAGVSDARQGLLHETQAEDWHRVLDVNLNGVFHTCRAALAPMARQGRGKVITVASMWGLAAPAGVFPRPAYAASKGAVVNLTREMALQYADKGIQVNALCPGIFQTETRPRDPAAGIAYTPMGRLGRVEEIAGATLFLASSASDFMTGQTLVIDGGVLAR
jgi:NAD(P)-dependent dehydrogenase (short-subunit alcohol dehydrogenase family)